jgi:hypothetical protein
MSNPTREDRLMARLNTFRTLLIKAHERLEELKDEDTDLYLRMSEAIIADVEDPNVEA